ncbi:MAG: hypothetical protein U1E45_10735 [Geminicoccaceae bacterium]
MADYTVPTEIVDDDRFWDNAERLAHTPCETVADALACAGYWLNCCRSGTNFASRGSRPIW